MARSQDDKEFKNWLYRKLDHAINNEEGDVSSLREHLFDRYYGKEYGNERDGASSFTTREVFEAIEWALPGLLRTFTGTDRAVEFEATNAADEAQARIETDIANQWLTQENNGFLMLHNWFKDILMYPNGYIKIWVEESTRRRVEHTTGITEENLAALGQNPQVEILEAEQYVEMFDGIPVPLFRLRVRFEDTTRDLKIMGVPQDQVFVDRNAESIDLDEAKFVAHRVRRTIGELVAEGYDYDDLIELSDSENDGTYNSERVNRLFYEDESPDRDDSDDSDDAERTLWVHEIYCEYDYDDDHIPEQRRVKLIGPEIFENDPDEYQPLVACSAIIMQHKHVGMAYAEAVADLQLLSTTLTRQMLDNIYKQNVRRHFMNEDALLPDNSTLDDYLDARSEVVLVSGPPAESIMPETVQSLTPELLEAIKHVKEQPQLRTGVAPNLSLDPNVLNGSTMGAFMGALDQATQRQELLVRVIAEVGYKVALRKVHYLMRTHLNQPGEMKIRGQWQAYNPAEWPERNRIKVNVGLGNAGTQQRMELLLGVLEKQEQALGMGLTDAKRVFHTLTKLIETAKLGSVDNYFIDPLSEEYQPPQPPEDPSMILAKSQSQALMAESQRKDAETKDKITREQKKLLADIQARIRDEERKDAELELRIEEMTVSTDHKDAELDQSAASVQAEVRQKFADAELKKAQTVKALADANKTDIDASDEVREAEDIIANGIEGQTPPGGGDESSGEAGSE